MFKFSTYLFSLIKTKATFDPIALNCSPALRRFKSSIDANGGFVSIRLAMTNFDNNNASATFASGDVQVDIGANDDALFPEPPRLAIRPRSTTVRFGPSAPFQINTGRSGEHELAVDLAVALPTTRPGSETEIQAVKFGVLRRSGAVTWLQRATHVPTSRAALERSNGVVRVSLSAAEAKLLQSRPLGIACLNNTIVLRERADGALLRAHPKALRLRSASAVSQIAVRTHKFGQPAAVSASLTQVPSPMRPRPDRINNEPTAGASFVSASSGSAIVLVTNSSGMGALNVSASSFPLSALPACRQPLRSNVYFRELNPLNRTGAVADRDGASVTLTARVWADENLSGNWSDVGPIFEQYAWLYPSMNQIVDMSSKQAVTDAAQGILATMTSDFYSAHYMPVSRDLGSNDAQAMIDFVSSTSHEPNEN